ncbi:hypothetical protein K438DRAFT_1754445 [Mycena galopus ATCC 62051]|nr:hypothetical protein K438DRAFT_1754445 [Mycena galopus ATCC 62051]
MPPRKKQKPNMSGLRNQKKASLAPPDASENITDTSDDDSAMGVHFDSLRVDWEHEDDSDVESEIDLDDFDDEEFTLRLAEMAEKEDSKDSDWLPPNLRIKIKERKDQDLLDNFGFSSSHAATSSLPITSKKLPPALKAAMLAGPPSAPHPFSPIILDDPSAPSSPTIPVTRPASASPEATDTEFDPISEPVSSAAVSDNEDITPMSVPASSGAPSEVEADMLEDEMSAEQQEQEQQAEAWEDELEDSLASTTTGPIRDWAEIRAEIKLELKKNSKILPLSRINQLMIVSNFATLRLKGVSRTQAGAEISRQWHDGKGKGEWFARRVRSLARHYQLFGKLPREARGGSRPARSWLHDERVKVRVLEYLRGIPTGKVTPFALQKHINSSLFPELDIKPKNPLSIRTARRWLIKLGWTHTLIKKGVYMDGHEREDVVHYRNHEFLPAMLKFEERMVHYEYYEDKGPELVRVEPKLKPGEKELIPLFHDECCFHANDEAGRAW